MAQFARFCLIGLLGFFIDAGILAFFIQTIGLDPFSARILSLIGAVSATWACHRNFTFKTENENRLAEWGRFLSVNLAGSGTNFAIYAAILLAMPGTKPLYALAVASILALVINYAGSALFAFRDQSHTSVR